MKKETVQLHIVTVISEFLATDPKEIKLDTRITALHADSIDQVEIIMALEEELNVYIPDEEAEKWETVDDVVNYITAHTELD
jgi:acyl carrier protein